MIFLNNLAIPYAVHNIIDAMVIDHLCLKVRNRVRFLRILRNRCLLFRKILRQKRRLL